MDERTVRRAWTGRRAGLRTADASWSVLYHRWPLEPASASADSAAVRSEPGRPRASSARSETRGRRRQRRNHGLTSSSEQQRCAAGHGVCLIASDVTSYVSWILQYRPKLQYFTSIRRKTKPFIRAQISIAAFTSFVSRLW